LLLLVVSECMAQLPGFDGKTSIQQNGRCNANTAKAHLKGELIGQLEPAGCTDLYLAYQSIDEDGMERLAAMIKASSSKLTTLHLNKNKIRDRGAKALAALLGADGALNKLQNLRLDDNEIHWEGAVALAESLMTHSRLTFLDLDINLMGNWGANAFAKLVRVNRALKELHLYSNHIGDEGAMALEEALKRNGVLEMVDLTGNEISQQVMSHVYEMIKVKPAADRPAKFVDELHDEDDHDEL